MIVAYENKIVMEETLEAGLARLFGTTTGQQAKPGGVTAPSVEPTDASKENLAKQATETYDAAIRAQKEGDWGRYGDEIKKLGEILNKLRQ